MANLERFSISLMYLRPDGPQLDEAELMALQDAHMAHLAELHESGHVLAGGPVLSPQLRGLSLYGGEVEAARALSERNPSVQRGRHRVEVYPWLVPAGAMVFQRTRFPRSIAEVEED